MDVPEVVRMAKKYVVDLFAEEQPMNVGLEEIEFDDAKGQWDVTIGFSRPWNVGRNALTSILGEEPITGRTYKIVRIRDADGQMVGLKQRSLAAG